MARTVASAPTAARPRDRSDQPTLRLGTGAFFGPQRRHGEPLWRLSGRDKNLCRYAPVALRSDYREIAVPSSSGDVPRGAGRAGKRNCAARTVHRRRKIARRTARPLARNVAREFGSENLHQTVNPWIGNHAAYRRKNLYPCPLTASARRFLVPLVLLVLFVLAPSQRCNGH